MSGYSNGDAIRRLLKALSDGRDLITEAYNAGGALPAGFDPDDQKLLSLRLFRVFTGTPDGYLLSPGLGEVIATALREDRSGYIDTAFEKRLQDAEEYAARAARHRKEGRYADADIALKSLKDAVRSIDYGVRHTVERLDLRITNRFGFVTSLDDKIAENQHAIDDTSRLIESLGKFTLAHFDEVSGGDREVYRILRALSDSIDESRRLLSAVLTRLSMLLMVFRREERETGVLRSFSEWFRKNNGAAVRDLGDDEEIPRLLWIPEALRSGGHADLGNAAESETLSEIIDRLPQAKPAAAPKAPEPAATAVKPGERTEELHYGGFEKDFREFALTAASEPGKDADAAEYYREHGLSAKYRLDHWLFGLLSSFACMPEERRRVFRIVPVKRAYFGDVTEGGSSPSGTFELRNLLVSVRKYGD